MANDIQDALAPRAVHKYSLKIGEDGAATVDMPIGSRVLHVDAQGDLLSVWAMTGGELAPRTFWVFGTGHEIPRDLSLEHRGSALMYSGMLVFHVFEEVYF